MNFKWEILLSGHQITGYGGGDVTNTNIKNHKKFNIGDSDNDNPCVNGEDICAGLAITYKDIHKDDCFLSCPNRNFNRNIKLSVWDF